MMRDQLHGSVPPCAACLAVLLGALACAALAAPSGVRAEQLEAHADHADTPPPFDLPQPTPEERAAAFPDLGEMDIRHITHDDPFVTFVLLDQLEVGDRDEGSVLHWDLKAWAGRDLSKVWLRSRGERHGGSTQHGDLEVLWGRAMGPWWDWVAGVRHDFRPGPSRTWAALGIQGLAPYWFELEGTFYLGEGGRAAARFEAEYELLLTNRLILQPVFKLAWHSEDDFERGIGSGLGSAEGGLRLRYEIRREVAPYVGVVRERRFGDTADLARAAGAPARDTWLVAGIRLWF
jgi:copper resistance protein B